MIPRTAGGVSLQQARRSIWQDGASIGRGKGYLMHSDHDLLMGDLSHLRTALRVQADFSLSTDTRLTHRRPLHSGNWRHPLAPGHFRETGHQ